MNFRIITKNSAADPEKGFLTKSISKPYGRETAMPTSWELRINSDFCIKDEADMIGFVISSHGQFGTVHQDGRRDEGLCIAFSCGLTSPVDVLLKENIVKIKNPLLQIL